jgi:hypothetical protein
MKVLHSPRLQGSTPINLTITTTTPCTATHDKGMTLQAKMQIFHQRKAPIHIISGNYRWQAYSLLRTKYCQQKEKIKELSLDSILVVVYWWPDLLTSLLMRCKHWQCATTLRVVPCDNDILGPGIASLLCLFHVCSFYLTTFACTDVTHS